MKPIKVLVLAGSPMDQFHADLSRVYASESFESLNGDSEIEFTLAWFHPDETVAFVADFQPETVATAKTTSLVDACKTIVDTDVDAALPQMFCEKGMV
ncbi:MAG: hypothetical protein AAF745_05655 [Planctomycetota bacterium]